LLAATSMIMLGILSTPAQARVGGITDIPDRQEATSCEYAGAEAPSAKRRQYSEACQRTAATEREAATAMAAPAVSYSNPVFGAYFPDPGALRDSPTDYYAYSTGGGFGILKSADLVNWQQIGQAFSRRPSWVVQSGDWHPWAPSVLRSPKSCPGTTSPGCYFMYYGGLSAQHTPETDCVGVAWSLTPSGPFTDLGPLQAKDGKKDLAGRPLGCGDAGGYGNIDAAPFVDSDGSVYLYLSTMRRCRQPTTGTCPYEPIVSVIPLASTPTRAKAARKPLFGATANSWEQQPGYAPQVEAPWMEKRGSTYYLFYSGGYYGARYGMGYATASTATGGSTYSAFAKSALNPILKETSAVLSPGGGSVTLGPDGGSWLVYHGRVGDYAQPRTLRIDPLYWSGSSVSTPGPTTGPQTVGGEPAGAPAPISHWRLGEKTGAVARDEQLAHDGSYVNGPALGKPGVIAGDTAVGFAANVNDYVDLGDISLGEREEFSTEIWVKTTSANTNRWLVGEGSTASSTPIWGLVHEGAKARAYYRVDGGAAANLVSTKAINDGAWHHLALTVKKGGLISLYVDGTLDAEAVTPAGAITLNTSTLAILRRATLGSEYAGELDEAAVYGSVLPASTVQDHSSRATTP